MLSSKQASFICVTDYLEGEKHTEIKHEYVNGDIYAMAGGSRNHNTLSFNLSALIGSRLQPSCQGYGSDMKIRIQLGQQNIFYYPDLSVSCQEETGDQYYNQYPVLIVEVLSPSTERLDKYEKFLAYRSLDSLSEYMLVHQDRREIWLFRRVRQWLKEVYTEGDITLGSIGVMLSLNLVYRGVGLSTV